VPAPDGGGPLVGLIVALGAAGVALGGRVRVRVGALQALCLGIDRTLPETHEGPGLDRGLRISVASYAACVG